MPKGGRHGNGAGGTGKALLAVNVALARACLPSFCQQGRSTRMLSNQVNTCVRELCAVRLVGDDSSEVLRGFEPRSLDSESRVLTVTPRDHGVLHRLADTDRLRPRDFAPSHSRNPLPVGGRPIDKPAIAQLAEHLTVDSRSNQMVPGSIPGGRILQSSFSMSSFIVCPMATRNMLCQTRFSSVDCMTHACQNLQTCCPT